MDSTTYAVMVIACTLITVMSAIISMASGRDRGRGLMCAITACFALAALSMAAGYWADSAETGQVLGYLSYSGLFIPWLWLIRGVERRGSAHSAWTRMKWLLLAPPAAAFALILLSGSGVTLMIAGVESVRAGEGVTLLRYTHGSLYLPVMALSAAAAPASALPAWMDYRGGRLPIRDAVRSICYALGVTVAFAALYMPFRADAWAYVMPLIALAAVASHIKRGAAGHPGIVINPLPGVAEPDEARDMPDDDERPTPSPASYTRPDRVVLMERLQKELDINERLKRTIALIQVALDNAGEPASERGGVSPGTLYTLLFTRIRDTLRKVDTVAITDEGLYVIMPQIVNAEQHISGLVNRLYEAVRTPLDVDGRAVSVTFVMGVTLSPSDAATVDEMIFNAGIALAFSRSTGKNRFSFFDPRMSSTARERWRVAEELRGAIGRGELYLSYQPTINTPKEDGAPVKQRFEALLRWKHSERGDISPGYFVPIAEEFGLMQDIGVWTIRAVCAQLRLWRDAGAPEVVVSVNLSIKQLFDTALISIVSDALSESGIPASSLEMEVDERAAFNGHPAIMNSIENLRALGVHVMIDSFNANQSSLFGLTEFPIDEIKLDSAFLTGGDENRKRAIMHAISVLCNDLDIPVTVKGVESEDSMSMLRQLAYDNFQGNFLSRPLTPEEAFLMMREGKG